VVDGNYDTDDWGFILVDARNAFNELNRYTILWRIRPYGLAVVGLHSNVFAAGFPFTSEDELGHHSLSSKRQGSPMVFFPCLFTDWLVYPLSVSLILNAN